MIRFFKNLLRREATSASSHAGRSSDDSEKIANKSSTPLMYADNPIRNSAQDVLGRAQVAIHFAEQILSLDASEGVVVGVLGPWGSGKTSLINLARLHLDKLGVPVLEFNPWMFSGAEQLVNSFFVELSAQLKLRPDLEEVGKTMEEYGEAFSGMGWLPLVGPWIERGKLAADMIGKILQRRKEGIGGKRTRVERTLAKLQKPLVVVVDDIDRLTSSEIRDIFKLVRLTANFPNIAYILSFDRRRIETALSEEGIPGRDYIEKILQVAIDIPAVPSSVLDSQITGAIDAALSEVEKSGPFDQTAWPDVYAEILRPLFRNMRDVRRYAATIHGTVRSLDGRVSLVDTLALEAIRIFLPDVFTALIGAAEGLTVTSDEFRGQNEKAALKTQIDRLVESGKDRVEVIKALIERLFPGGQWHTSNYHVESGFKSEWLRNRRVAHREILNLYLERVIGAGLQAFADAERAWEYMGDANALDAHLRSLELIRLPDVIASLETYQTEFRTIHVVPGSVVLLNLLPSLPERGGGMLSFGPSMVVARVVLRLLRAIDPPEAMESAVKEIFVQVTTLTSKLQLLDLVGHRPGVGHKLISEPTMAELQREWRLTVRATRAELLASEKELFRILIHAKREAEPSESPLTVPDQPSVTLRLLESAKSEVQSQAMGSRAVHRSPRLAWNLLVELYGSETILAERIQGLRNSDIEGKEDIVRLADKYLGGWRPNERD